MSLSLGAESATDIRLDRIIESFTIDQQSATCTMAVDIWLENAGNTDQALLLLHRGSVHCRNITRESWEFGETACGPAALTQQLLALHATFDPIARRQNGCVALGGAEYALWLGSAGPVAPLIGGDPDNDVPFTLWEIGPFAAKKRHLVRLELRLMRNTYARLVGAAPDFYAYGDAILLDLIKNEDLQMYHAHDLPEYVKAWDTFRVRLAPAMFEWLLVSPDGRSLPWRTAPLSPHIYPRIVPEAYRHTVQWYVTREPQEQRNRQANPVNAFAIKVASQLPEPQPEGGPEEFLGLALVGDRLKLVLLQADGTYQLLDRHFHTHDILYVSSAETISFRRAVEELEDLINDKTIKEIDLQRFFERNPELLLQDGYKEAHSHIVLARDDDGPLILDFVLEPVNTSLLCDLLEIKLPSASVFSLRKNRVRISSAVAEARAQLLEYGRYFEEKRHRDLIEGRYGLRAYRPKMFVLIGRTGRVDPFERRKVESAEPDLNLLTYDDMILRAKARIDRMTR